MGEDDLTDSSISSSLCRLGLVNVAGSKGGTEGQLDAVIGGYRGERVENSHT